MAPYSEEERQKIAAYLARVRNAQSEKFDAIFRAAGSKQGVE